MTNKWIKLWFSFLLTFLLQVVGRILAELMIQKYFSNILTEIDGETLSELT